MSHKHTIIDIPKYIKHARETAAIGEYDKSLELYRKILKIINERSSIELTDPYLIQKWKTAENKIKNECALVFSANQICKTFQEDPTYNHSDINNNNNRILMRDYKLNKKQSTPLPDEDRWAHFGGMKPFEYLSQDKQPYNYVIEKKNPNYWVDMYKDPDVWDDPELFPRFPGMKPPNKSSSSLHSSSDKKIEYKPLMQFDDLEKKRNYDKPWRNTSENAKKQAVNKGSGGVNKKQDQQQCKPNKSEFLLKRYPPDGRGPDTDLIEMIEREVVNTNPNVSFEDIAGLQSAKKALQEAVLLPLLLPNFFKGLRRPWKGVLLYGPPGTGKTLLAKALATQGKTTFFNLSSSSFASKWRGESEKLVRILFEMARFYGPSTVFIDEIDSIGGKRGDGEGEASRRVMAEMLVQMDGISSVMNTSTESSNNNTKPNGGNGSNVNGNEQQQQQQEERPKNVTILGATNHPWDLDEALRRRFEKRIYIPLPNKEGRKQVFEINLKGVAVDKDVNFDELVKKTEGYSGADITNICREAAFMQMRRKLEHGNGKDGYDIMNIVNNKEFQEEINAPVYQKDILAAIKNISKSVSKNDLKRYEDWTNEFSNK